MHESRAASAGEGTAFVQAGDLEVLAWLVEQLSDRCSVHAARSFADFRAVWRPVAPQCTFCDLDEPAGDALRTLRWLRTSMRERAVAGGVVALCRVSCARSIVRAMRLGAVDVLQLPVTPAELTRACARALRASRHQTRTEGRQPITPLLARLSHREREVFDLATSGLTSRQIAFQLGLSKRTVDVHRSSFLRKLGASSVFDLLRLYTV